MKKTLFIFDLDGVIYRGKKLLPYSKKTVNFLQKSYKIFFFTNNSTRTREQYCERLKNFGINCSINSIMTSGYATALYFQEKKIKNANVFVVGGEGVIWELKNIGLNVITDNSYSSKIKYDYIVVGLDPEFNYKKLALAQQVILKGAKFIATNRDNTYPAENTVLPGAGSIVSAIEAASGVKPFVIGKPKIYSLRKILELANAKKHETIIIGDRLETDILIGKKFGIKTVLLLTGVTKEEDLKKAKEKPDYVIKNLSYLVGSVLDI